MLTLNNQLMSVGEKSWKRSPRSYEHQEHSFFLVGLLQRSKSQATMEIALPLMHLFFFFPLFFPLVSAA